jgi:O-methyltransferase involved in polyketide biosynthesis
MAAEDRLGIDPSVPNVARMYDYWLGGVHNFAADRQAAEEILAAVPEARASAAANRAFVRRVVRFLAADAGISQFIDIGAGLPTQGNVHEVAQEVNPVARVVYADYDPVVVAHGRALLMGNPSAASILGDVRRPEEILANPELRSLADLSQPVALLLTGVLHFIDDADADGAYSIVRRLTASLSPGSYLAVSHGCAEGMNTEPTSEPGNPVANAVFRRSTVAHALWSRSRAEVSRFFVGCELLAPGVVWVPEWRPESGGDVTNPGRSHFLGALGRLP